MSLVTAMQIAGVENGIRTDVSENAANYYKRVSQSSNMKVSQQKNIPSDNA